MLIFFVFLFGLGGGVLVDQNLIHPQHTQTYSAPPPQAPAN